MKTKLKEYLTILLELSKVRITVSVTFTTAVGYLLFKGRLDVDMLIVSLGVFILSCGSSAFNHFQERKYDALMTRTMKRPIADGRITPTQGFAIASILVLFGLWILVTFTNWDCFLLGVAALFWYNILYTPLKRVSSLAVIPGSVIGSIPPMIGWACAGGYLLDPTIVFLALFVFIWQIPHFWLLLLIYDEDYKKADYPTLTNIIGPISLKRLTYIWIIALVTCGVIIPYFSFTKDLIVLTILFVLGLVLSIRSRKVITQVLNRNGYFGIFTELNIYVLVVLLILSINRLIS